MIPPFRSTQISMGEHTPKKITGRITFCSIFPKKIEPTEVLRMAYVICWTSSPIIFSRHHCPYTQGHTPSASEVAVFILQRLSMLSHTPSGHLLESFSDHSKAQLLLHSHSPMFPTIMTSKYLGVILSKLGSKQPKCFLSPFFT